MGIKQSEWLTTFASIWMHSMVIQIMGVSMMGLPLFYGNGQKDTTSNGRSFPINSKEAVIKLKSVGLRLRSQKKTVKMRCACRHVTSSLRVGTTPREGKKFPRKLKTVISKSSSIALKIFNFETMPFLGIVNLDGGNLRNFI
nr:hypothetical protein Iba_chr04bCG8220 [Ipomoea batatas]GMC84202.1 hypothetical protein Iba_chr04cCG9340 [Ipomoea batatas]GMC94582.1 hypothetical protein Iba_scaffold37541CG0010 [Ipomoea batatas]GME21474.1 hypothetical protein Iba_scaffold27943CG0010 [Ipomoea batatas]